MLERCTVLTRPGVPVPNSRGHNRRSSKQTHNMWCPDIVSSFNPTLLCSAGERLVHLRIVTAAESLGNDAATESSRVANERYTPNAFYHFLQAHRQPFAAVALGNMGNLDRNELRNLYATYIAGCSVCTACPKSHT